LFSDHLLRRSRRRIVTLTSDVSTVGLWGLLACARTSSRRSQATTSRTRLALQHLEETSPSTACRCSASRISYVVRLGLESSSCHGRRARGSGRCPGRPAFLTASFPPLSSDRRLRRDGPAREGLSARSRRGSTRTSNVVEADWVVEGEGRRLRRQEAHVRAPWRRSRSRALHATIDTMGKSREAYPRSARPIRYPAERDRRAHGRRALRDDCRRRAVARQAHPHVYLPRHAEEGTTRGRVHARAVTRERSRSAARSRSFDPEREIRS